VYPIPSVCQHAQPSTPNAEGNPRNQPEISVRRSTAKSADRYNSGTTTLIGGVPFDGRLALVTTTSALGRSSLYNRLRCDGRLLYQPVGWTQGSGDFQFANGLYKQMSEYAKDHFDATAKHSDWGTGFRNRREIVKRCLSAFQLPHHLLYHGVRRQIFVVPLAQNATEFLRGEHRRLRWFRSPCRELSEFCRQRWLVPRARSDERYRTFDPRSLRLWE
jgi:hypothetical protein